MIYIFKNKLIVSILAALLFIGCGYKESNAQIRDIGYLKFNKTSTKTYTVMVNNKYKFILDACVEDPNTSTCYDNSIDKLYEVSSGNIIIEVFDEKENLIIHKEAYLGSSNTIVMDIQW